MADNQWTLNCAIFGAELFKKINKRTLTRQAALDEVKNLSSSLTDEEASYLVLRITDLIDPQQ